MIILCSVANTVLYLCLLFLPSLLLNSLVFVFEFCLCCFVLRWCAVYLFTFSVCISFHLSILFVHLLFCVKAKWSLFEAETTESVASSQGDSHRPNSTLYPVGTLFTFWCLYLVVLHLLLHLYSSKGKFYSPSRPTLKNSNSTLGIHTFRPCLVHLCMSCSVICIYIFSLSPLGGRPTIPKCSWMTDVIIWTNGNQYNIYLVILPALRALGLLLTDGASRVGWGKTFWRVGRFGTFGPKYQNLGVKIPFFRP